MPTLQPRWPTATLNRISELTENFRDNLRRVAIRFARQEEAVNVDVRHVNEAFASLSRLGLNRIPGWKRPEFEVGAGSLIAGLAFSSPDVVPLFFADASPVAKSISVAAVVLLLASGVFLAAHGWFRGRL